LFFIVLKVNKFLVISFFKLRRMLFYSLIL
jgi:hypothetical protein